jgi:hypothetical protein
MTPGASNSFNTHTTGRHWVISDALKADEEALLLFLDYNMATLREFSKSLYDFHGVSQSVDNLSGLCNAAKEVLLKYYETVDEKEFNSISPQYDKKCLKDKLTQFIDTVNDAISKSNNDYTQLDKIYGYLFDQGGRAKHKGSVATLTKRTNFYRVRSASDYKLYNREELFVIPPDKLNLVGQYRFNHVGCPCLYLASNLYLAWEECRRPDFTTVNFSRFENVQDLKVLDLTIKPIFRYVGDFYMAYLTLLCCAKANDTDKFKFQYVVPNLMMSLLLRQQSESTERTAKNRLDGIRYLSSRRYDCSDFLFDGHSLSVAFVFPDNSDNSLKQLFRMTSPRSYFLYKIHRFNWDAKYARISDYQNSLFYQLECQLKTEKLDKVP